MRSHFKPVIIAALVVWTAAFSSSYAQTIDFWKLQTGGSPNWTTAANWQLGTPPASAGDIANIMADITGAQTIVFGGATQTVGILNLGDFNATHAYTIGLLSNSDTLSFDNSTWGGIANLGGLASLNKVQGSTGDSISDVQLVSNLGIYNRVAFTIAGNITELSPGASLLKRGTANLTLTGVNSYTGDTIIHTTGGTVLLNYTHLDIDPGVPVVLDTLNSINSPLIRLGNSTRDGTSQVRLQLSQSNQISDLSVIRFDGAGGREAFFQLNGQSETIKGISDVTSNGVIENAHASNASTLTLDMDVTDSSYNGYLRNGSTGTLAVVKNGTGTLKLAGGRVSFTGGMTVNDGALVLTNLGNNTFGSNVDLVAATSSLQLESTADYIFTKGVSGAGGVSKTGTATVTMTQNNAATGITTLANGTLRLSGASGGISAASALDLMGGTLLISNRTGGAMTGATAANNATITVADTSGLAIGMSVTGPNIPAGVVITSIATNGTQFNISANATAAGTGVTITAANGNVTDRIGDAIPINSQGGGIRFDNGGGAASNYTETMGTLTLNSGTTTITAGRTGTLADPASSVLTLSGLTRQAHSTLNFTDTGTGAALGTASNKIMFTGGLNTDDNIVGGWATVGNEWATYGANGVAALASGLYNTGAFGTWTATSNVKLTGAGQTLGASNITINSLNIQNPTALTLGLNGRELTIASGGIIASGNANIIHTIGTDNSFAGLIKVASSAGHAPGFSELVTTVETSRTLRLFSQVANNGSTPLSLIKNGGGKLILTPNATTNTYSGGTTINGGSIEIRDVANLGSPAGTGLTNYLVMDGGALEQSVTSITISGAGRQITMAAGGGRFELDTGENLTIDASVPITGPGKFTLGAGDGTGGIFNAHSVMSMQGGLQVSAGTMYLNNLGNTFSGGVTITGGTLVVPATGSTIPDGQSLDMTGGALRILGSTDPLNPNTVVFSSLTAPVSTNIVIEGPSSLDATGYSTVYVNQDVNSTYGGRLNDTSASKILNLYKDGTGTLTLSNTSSTYRGITTIAEGSLAVTTLQSLLINSSLGRGAAAFGFDSADRLVINSGAALIYVGTQASITNRAFTMGLGDEGASIIANGTVTGASVTFNPRTVSSVMETVKFTSPGDGTGPPMPATLTLGGLNAGQNKFGLKLVDNGIDSSSMPNYLSLVKTGSGTWILTNAANTYSGSTTVYEGRLSVSVDGALGSKGVNTPPVQVVGGVLDLKNVNYTAAGSDTEDLILGGGRLDASSGTSFWGGKIDVISSSGPNVSAGRSAQLTLYDINGQGVLDKDGFGTVVLAGTNSYTGSTRIRDGTLTLDYTTTPGDNKLSDTAALIFGGGRTGGILTILGSSAGTDETVGSTSLERGQHEIIRGDAGNARINLKAITVAAGALLDIEEDNLALTSRDNTSNYLTGGILGPWATVGHSTWAYKEAGNGLTGVIKGLSNAQYTPNLWSGATINTDALVDFTVPASSTTNTIRFNQTTPVTVTLSGNNTLQSGGILVTPSVNTVHQITGGTLTSGTGSTEVVVQQFSPTSGFLINSVIANRVLPTAVAIGVQKLGPGVLALTGDNTYTGLTTIGAGTLLVNKLTDGGVAGPLGQATFAAANTVIAGGTLEYAGETTTVNRGFTVKEFGSLNVGDEDMTLTISGSIDTANVGAIVGDAGTAFWEKNGAGTLRVLRKEVSGGASGIQQLDVTDGKLILEWGYSTTFSPLSPSGPSASNQLLNASASLKLSGGKLELVGEDFVFNNGNSLQQILGQFVVGAGASELQVTSHASLNPSIGAGQTTTLAIGDANNAQVIDRELGGTVLFVENPNGGTAAITLATFAASTNSILPWATYWDKSSIVQPGVNNFAIIEPTGNGIESADANSLYAVKSNPSNWTNNGLENISEEGVTAFGGSNVSSGMQISTLRFFNAVNPGTLTLNGSLTLTNGAILAAYNVRDQVKTITGGSLTSTYLPEDGQAELMIHNYNVSTPLLIQSVIANPTGLASPAVLNLVHTGTGTTSLSGTNTYSGRTIVTGGVLKLESANALPGGVSSLGTSALTLDGGVIGLTAASGDFTRGLGSGVNQMQWLSSGGFAAYGSNRSVNIGGAGAQVIWGVNGFVPSGDTLVLSASDASGTLSFQNPIELGVTDRLVRVENGSAAEDAVLSGALTGFGSLTKSGEGALRLTGTNTHKSGVTLAEGTLFVPSPTVLGPGTLSVGTTGNTSPYDAPVLVLESGTIANAFNVGNKNTEGITSVEVPDNVVLNGTVTLDKTGIFVGPDSGKSLTVNNVVSGTGGLTLVDGGKIVLNGSNTYGTATGAAGTAIDGSTIVRNGTIEVRTSTALGDGTKAVELGDMMITPVTVDRATTGASLIASKGTFDPNGNGVPFSVNGEGAFYNISSTVDGFTYGAGDVNTLILVKDQFDNPEQNGVYKIVSVGLGGAGTMNISREINVSPQYALYTSYGSGVTVQNGAVNGGQKFFLARNVDVADVNVDGFYWKAETSQNPNVSMLVAGGLASPITNPIDINDTNGTGTTTIGFTSEVIHGSTTLSGNVTLQSQIAGAEDKDLFLNAEVCADLVFGGSFTDPGAGDTLNLIKTGTGTVTLSGASDFNGSTKVQGGVLKLENASALGATNSGSGNLNIAGGVVGLTTASGDLTTRALGTGAGQVQWTDSGGFAAYQTNRSVTLSSGTATWGSGSFVPDTKSLVLGAKDATAKITFTNDINLGTSGRTVNVPNGPVAVEAELSGAITGTGASGALVKTGQGTLLLSGANTYAATTGTILAQGTLQGKRLASGNVFGTTAVAVGGTATQTGDALKLEFLGDNVSDTTYVIANNITVGTQNATGTTSIDATHGTAVLSGTVDVNIQGTVALGRSIFAGPDAGAILQVSGAISGATSRITVVDGGTLRLSSTNSYGSGLAAPSGPAIDGATIIRNGTVEVTTALALGNGTAASTVELGDARNNLALVDRASGGTALSDCGAIFSSGIYSGVSVDFGGGTYSAGDIGTTRLLVKDETSNPERNGIYQISAVSGSEMTLERVSDFDAPSEMIYGSTVQVTNGAVPNQQYFLTGNVATVNSSAALWRATASNPNVALLATSALTIANNIDLNASGSSGTTTLGAVSTLTSGSVTYSGTVTMQSQNAGVENLILDITSSAITSTATGVTLSGVISENGAGPDSLKLRKVGDGVATLTNNNTYTGGTDVNAGVLLVNNTAGSGTGLGAVTVSGVGTVLGGTGTIAGITTINADAILMPGAGVNDANAVFDSTTESLAFSGGLTLGSGSKALFQLNGTSQGNSVSGYDFVNVTGGTLTFNSTALIQVVLFAGYNPVIGNSFDLFDWVSLPVTDGNLADQLQLPTLSSGEWDTTAFNGTGVITVVVPEPARFIFIVLGLAVGILRRRRSR